ncbi:hypothetical protein P389DRAFT_88551 [Cystobasidium minutum MCA 4210]|uniref:uncharacterized protein n=1 Tax=Cystobasidium minutum MCA 4210 TaxID=1397322 RepID=UPI0034CD9CD7|eukprot:jgi/Rhomi1/88551/CE88550_107
MIWQVTGSAKWGHVPDHLFQVDNIRSPRAMVGINKYANDAIFVYYDGAIENGRNPGNDDWGATKQDSIKSCNALNENNEKIYKGCKAFELRTNGTFHSLVFAIRPRTNTWPSGWTGKGKGTPDEPGLYDKIPAKVEIRLHTNEVDGRAFFKCQGLPDGQDHPPPAR